MSYSQHPGEGDLALLAGGETSRAQRFLLARHVRNCPDCREKVAEYRALREDLADTELPDLNWNFLASEMRANIRVGLEAGACVRGTRVSTPWSQARSWAAALGPRAAVGFATLAVLLASGFYVRDVRSRTEAAHVANSVPVLQTTSSGVVLRDGDTSMMLLNPSDAISQTVSARGEIGARTINAGTVTITSGYLE